MLVSKSSDEKTDDPIYYLVEQPGTSEHPQLQKYCRRKIIRVIS